MLPLKKIYIDSRDRTVDSKSASNFKIELPNTVQMPDNTVFFVTDVCVPHVWKTIEEGFNDRLYLMYSTPLPPAPGSIGRHVIVYLTEGNYKLAELAAHIQTQINASIDDVAKSYTTFAVTADTTNNSLTISMTGSSSTVSFKLYTDAEVVSTIGLYWIGSDPGNLKSANDVLTLVSPMKITTSYQTGFVNLTHTNNVYITSPNLGSFDTLATFSNNIIKKVPVNAPYGYMVVDQNMSTNDFLNCSRQTLRTLEFHLRDGRGREIDLKGMYITFSLVFNKYNLEG